MKKLFVLLFIVLVSVNFFSYDKIYEEIDENIVAVVNGEEIFIDLVNARSNTVNLFSDLRESYSNFYNLLINTKEGLSLLDKYIEDVLERVINQKLFIQYVENKGINLNKDLLKEDLYSRIDAIFSDDFSKEEIDFFLFSQGYENIDTLKYDRFMTNLYERSIEMLYDKIASGFEVTDNEIKKEYEENKHKYYSKPKAELKVLRFESFEEAERTYSRITDGSYSFEELFDLFKETNDADLITIDITEEQSELMDIIRNNAPGFITRPIALSDDNGEQIMFKIYKKNPSRLLDLEQVKELIILNIQDNKAKLFFQNDLEKEFQLFRENSTVVINNLFF